MKSHVLLAFLGAAALHAVEPPKPPLVLDPALRIEVIATAPEIEAPTTVVGAPDGSVYVGCDPRDARLNTDRPECYIVRFGFTSDTPDQIRLPDGTLAPPGPRLRQRTIFAKDIFSPAGSAWFDGWLYVAHDPFLTRFKDTDGDGIADVREDLITNLGVMPQTGLNDHCASGFTLGMDGYFYMSIGDRGTYQTKSVKDGSTISMQGGGIIRFRPDGTALEVFSTGTRNHLEVALDAEDNAFTLDNTDDGNGWWTRLTHHIQGGYYGYPYDYQRAENYGVTQPSEQTLDAMKRNGHAGLPPATFLPAMADFGGGSPTGGLCYLSDGLPEFYRGKLLFSDWGKSGLFLIEVVRDGATFRFVKNTPVLQADKGTDFRPMQISVAGDGSLLIADWAWGGWKGPKTVGTIWRLSWPEAKPAPRLPDENKASIDELLVALTHPDRDQRLRAEYALVKAGHGDQFPRILQSGHPHPIARLHAIGGIQQWGRILAVENKISSDTNHAVAPLNQVVTDADPVVRARALRALTDLGYGITLLAIDPDPRVRLQAAVDAAGIKFKASIEDINRSIAAALAGEKTMARVTDPLADPDPFIRFAANGSLRAFLDWVPFAMNDPREIVRDAAFDALGRVWEMESIFCLGEAARGKTPAHRTRAITALGQIAYQAKPWDGHWWGTQPVKSPAPLNNVAWEGTPKALATLTAALADSDSGVRLAAAKAFAILILDDSGKPAGAALRDRLTAEHDPAVRRQLIEALGVQKDSEAMPVFMKIAIDDKADAAFRDAAIAAVVGIGGDDAKKIIAQLAGAALSPAATRKIVQAAGELKVVEAAPALIVHMADENPGNREFAVKALSQIGAKANARDALIGALADKDSKVQAAAVEALGNLKDKAALPALLEFSKTKKARRETINAIAAMPDTTSLAFLVDALREKGGGERRSALGALKKMRVEAWPMIEENLASGRIPAEFSAEIRAAFESGVIARWKVAGPFENVWEAVHPPETDAIAGGNFRAKKYTNAEGKETGWEDVSGESDTGRVDLGKFFHTSGMVCAYAVAEIEATEAADAKLFAAADDQIAVWLNGKKVHDRAVARTFQPDTDEVALHLVAGRNTLLVKSGNLAGAWEFAARIPGLDGGRFTPSREPAPDIKQRAFALAAKPDGSWLNAGDAKRGEILFHDKSAALGGICATCHTVKGKGGAVGPDLSAVGVNYKRPDLIVSILEPSKTIALGFEQAMFETNGGETFIGAVRQETADAFTLVGADAAPHIVNKTDVKKRTPIEASLMPPGLTLGLKPDEFADLLAYLETLR